MRSVLIGITLAVAATIPVSAQQVYALSGAGVAPCGAWAASRQDPVAQQLPEQWMLGFLSGVGWEAVDGTNPLNGMDTADVFSWIDRYCREHPSDTIATAGGRFVMAHPAGRTAR